MKRKLVSVILCGTMVFGMMTGCGSSGDANSDSGNGQWSMVLYRWFTKFKFADEILFDNGLGLFILIYSWIYQGRGKMQEVINDFIILMKAIGAWLSSNRDSIISGIVATVILGIVVRSVSYVIKKPKELNELLKTNNFNDLNMIEELDKSLQIKDTMKRNFPEYSDYLLIQYGSSVDANNQLPQDYDFIVLMLGFPKEGRRYLHNKGTNGLDDVSSKGNMFDVDIVYRDYLSFLYAATAGMPYENSVIVNGKLLKGHQGYFLWLKNITQNHLYDRDFLIRRFKNKITTEKQEFNKCLLENKKFEHEKYYVIRAGYYYITSLLQLKHIKKFEKVIFQDDLIKLSKVRMFYKDFKNETIKNKYSMLVECLKRNSSVNDISIDDIQSILDEIEHMEIWKMFEKIKLKIENKLNRGIFSESTLKTSFYEELQKNGWCDIVDDKPDNLTKMVQIKIKKTVRV